MKPSLEELKKKLTSLQYKVTYNDEDLDRFGKIGKHYPELFKKFMDWHNASS
jgi:hypothetical protein